MTKVNPTPRLRTAAYCRIVGGEEQSAVLESQKTCYTERIYDRRQPRLDHGGYLR